MRKNTGFKIDLAKNTLTLNYKYNRLANEYGSDEYQKVHEILAENPGMRIVVESGHKAKTPHHSRRLTYKNMERYINAQDNAEELMTTFALVQEESKKEKSPYAFVRTWFLVQFGDLHDIRVFIEKEDGTTTMQKVPHPKIA